MPAQKCPHGILSAAELVAWKVQEVARGFRDGEWSIRGGCGELKLNPQTYYAHRRKQNAKMAGKEGAPIAAETPLSMHPMQEATQTPEDSTKRQAA